MKVERKKQEPLRLALRVFSPKGNPNGTFTVCHDRGSTSISYHADPRAEETLKLHKAKKR